jgi:signal transduction histidine kinase
MLCVKIYQYGQNDKIQLKMQKEIEKFIAYSLSDDSLVEGKENLAVYIDVNKDKKTITITDNGIGMTETEVNKNIGIQCLCRLLNA